MPAYIFDPDRFHKKLHKMTQAGGKAQDAVDQAWKIILLVAAEEQITPWLGSKLTHYGEARLHTFLRTWSLFDQRGEQSLLELDE